MPLYRDVERIFNELRQAGLDNEEPVEAADLAAFDQYHYHGTAAVDLAVNALQIGADDTILEIGSGIGGPARHIAASSGANVVALELQPDLNEVAENLTRRCGLSCRIDHVCADVMDYSPAEVRFDAIVSWLALFHIEQRAGLLQRCHGWLQEGAGIFVEDMYARGEFTAREKSDLDEKLFSRYLPSRANYENDFRQAGFSLVQVNDMSDDWRQFTAERYAEFCRSRDCHVALHGSEVVAGLESFYGAVAGLFANGSLGGIRLVARRA